MSLNVELLEQSFEQVKPQANQFASSFYKNLLTDYPELQPLFSETDMEAQEQKLIMSLVLVVQNLHSPDYLKSVLQNLGERHVSYGTKQEHYEMVGAALLKTFESYLGTDWTPNVKQAWTDAYGAIVDMMLIGAKPAEEALKLGSIPQFNANVVSAQLPVQTSTASITDYSEQPYKSYNDNSSQPPAHPVEMNKASIYSPKDSKLNYAPNNSKLENAASHNNQPVLTEPVKQQVGTTKFSFNLKLLLIVSIAVGALGIGFLYYHTNSQQDSSSVESPLY